MYSIRIQISRKVQSYLMHQCTNEPQYKEILQEVILPFSPLRFSQIQPLVAFWRERTTFGASPVPFQVVFWFRFHKFPPNLIHPVPLFDPHHTEQEFRPKTAFYWSFLRTRAIEMKHTNIQNKTYSNSKALYAENLLTRHYLCLLILLAK